MKKQTALKKAKRVLQPNRFLAARVDCPRCGKTVVASNFIVNTNVNGLHQSLPLITFACPACGDAVQVMMEGESVGAVDRAYRREAEKHAL